MKCFKELEGLGLDRATCWEMVEMLAFLIDKNDGGDGTGYLEILREDLTMLQAEDSLFYRYGVEKGIEKGIEGERQRLRNRALHACRQRFSSDEAGLALLAERLQKVQDFDALADFLLHLATTRTLDDAIGLLPPPSMNGHGRGD